MDTSKPSCVDDAPPYFALSLSHTRYRTLVLSKTKMATVSGEFSGAVSRTIYPFTTIWTPPSGCPLIVQMPTSQVTSTCVGCSRFITTPTSQAAARCLPSGLELIAWYAEYYSPGVCMSGYIIGHTQEIGSLNNVHLEVSETAAICIPRQVLVTLFVSYANQTQRIYVSTSKHLKRISPDQSCCDVSPLSIRCALVLDSRVIRSCFSDTLESL